MSGKTAQRGANVSDTTLSSNGSMGKRLPKAPVSSAKKLTNVGKTKTGFREN